MVTLGTLWETPTSKSVTSDIRRKLISVRNSCYALTTLPDLSLLTSDEVDFFIDTQRYINDILHCIPYEH